MRDTDTIRFGESPVPLTAIAPGVPGCVGSESSATMPRDTG